MIRNMGLLSIVFGLLFICLCSLNCCFGAPGPVPTLVVNATGAIRQIPNTLFGIFFEEINHAGAGGLWAELVNNRGFEAGGDSVPSNIDPWGIIGDEKVIIVATDRSSIFERNKIALRMDILCGVGGPPCPVGGVGIFNPGFWGMNIENGKGYKLVFYVRSNGPIDFEVAITDATGAQKLAVGNRIIRNDVGKWTRVEAMLTAKGANENSRLQFTTQRKGAVWFDQVSLMPVDTYKGHGFRNDLFGMLKDMKPAFMRFPGGCFVEGEWLRNAVRWKETVGNWEERPGHFGNVWMYWTDDGIGHYEFLQLCEDLETAPIWVFNNGVSHQDQVDTTAILPFVQEIMDGLEFARGDAKSRWGSLRAAMGHPAPFNLKYVAVGNEDCGKKNYRGNYIKFYDAIKKAYPDIQIISNCDASRKPLDHPADLYDYHIYSNAETIFAGSTYFDQAPRNGPKAFVSEYAVMNDPEKHNFEAGTGSLLAALAEAGYAMGMERNSDAVAMSSYAPLFVHTNDRRWNPDAIVFNSAHVYGTPSYWQQLFFKESNGATLLSTKLDPIPGNRVLASGIIWVDPITKKSFLRVKVLNFGNDPVTLKISIQGLPPNSINAAESSSTILTSANVLDENSFQNPLKVAPVKTPLKEANNEMTLTFASHAFYSLDLSTTVPPAKAAPTIVGKMENPGANTGHAASNEL